jgi:hypothetical protein
VPNGGAVRVPLDGITQLPASLVVAASCAPRLMSWLLPLSTPLVIIARSAPPLDPPALPPPVALPPPPAALPPPPPPFWVPLFVLHAAATNRIATTYPYPLDIRPPVIAAKALRARLKLQ